MFIIDNIKKFFIKRKIPKIEAIKTYEDVNLFLAGYKYYFDYVSSAWVTWIFCFDEKGFNIEIIRESLVFIPMIYRYRIDGYREPNIRAFVWEHRDSINAELLRRNESAEISKRIRLRKEILEKKIKNNLPKSITPPFRTGLVGDDKITNG